MIKATDNILAAATRLPQALKERSGSTFYSGQGAFQRPTRLYVLGLNPGGSPTKQAAATIGKDLEKWPLLPWSYSRYLDEGWEGKAPGGHGMQPQMQHMFHELGLDLRATPASNLVFVRSASEAQLSAEKASLMKICWPVHQEVIDGLEIDTLLCLGGTCGRWVRERLGAGKLIDRYVETNARGWTSEMHVNSSGKAVVTVTHPGRTNWRNPAADPTALVQRALDR